LVGQKEQAIVFDGGGANLPEDALEPRHVIVALAKQVQIERGTMGLTRP
jgi:hypothetical protein